MTATEPSVWTPPAAADCRAWDDPLYEGDCMAGCGQRVRAGYERQVRPGVWGQRVCRHCAAHRLDWPVSGDQTPPMQRGPTLFDYPPEPCAICGGMGAPGGCDACGRWD